MAKKKATRSKAPRKPTAAKLPTKSKPTTKVAAPAATAANQNGKAPASKAAAAPRLLPNTAELKSLYDRYTGGAKFDDHDKAFYFVLDVGGISRAKQLVAHVEEVLAELEELN